MLAFRIAYALHDDLLGCLRTDTPEIDGLQAFFNVVFKLNIFDLFSGIAQAGLLFGELNRAIGYHQPTPERLKLARCTVNFNPHISFFVDAFFGRGCQGHFEGDKNDVLLDTFFAGKRIN